MDLSGKRCLIFGNGISGKGALSRLNKLNGTGNFYDGSFKREDYDFAVISPYMSIYSKEYARLISSGIPVFSEPDFAFLTGTDTTIGVTGTNGKTTVVRYVEQLFKGIGKEGKGIGNIGYALSSYYGNGGICEISSYMLEQSSYFKCDYSVVTNIQPDHLDRHRTFAEYRRVKLKMFALTRKGIAVNINSPFYNDIPKSKIIIEYSLSDKGNLFVSGDKIVYNDGSRHILYEGANIPCGYERENYLQALALCIMTCGLSEAYFKVKLKKDLYRMQYMGIYNGKKVYNDSKGTNIGATLAGLSSLEGNTILIVGGYDKGEDYSKLMVGGFKLYIIGQNANKIIKSAEEYNKEYLYFNSLSDALDSALKADCDNILFSPTCASFDQYNSYIERGEHFNELLRSLS